MKRIPAVLLCTTILTGFAVAAPAGAQTSPPPMQAPAAEQAPPAMQQAPAATQQAPADQQGAPASDDDASGAQQEPAAAKPAEIQYYNYANDESEYSIKMPQAPTVSTIWATSPETKLYLDGNLPKSSSFLGEVGLYTLTDMDTEESYRVKTIFLKAPGSFLASLNSATIEAILRKSYAHKVFISPTYHYSASKNAGALKWGTLSGFTVDENHQPLFTATHYLTGAHSIFVVRVSFSVTNPLYNRYYNDMVGSITYSPP